MSENVGSWEHEAPGTDRLPLSEDGIRQQGFILFMCVTLWQKFCHTPTDVSGVSQSVTLLEGLASEMEEIIIWI